MNRGFKRESLRVKGRRPRGECLLVHSHERVMLHDRPAGDEEQLERWPVAENQSRDGIDDVDVRERVHAPHGHVGLLARLQ